MISTRQGITLTELIIALSLVGVMMLAIVSVDRAIRKKYEDSLSGASSTDNATQVLTQVIRTAELAVGSLADKGIMTDGNGDLGANILCIRKDYTPPWSCYSVDTGTKTLYSCTRGSANACSSGDTDYVAVGSANGISSVFDIVGTTGNQSLLFTLTVTVPTGATTTRTTSASISPPKHRI